MADRINTIKKYAYGILAVLLCLFVMAAVNTNLFSQQPNLALFGMLGTLLVFIDRPLIKRWIWGTEVANNK
ncbi:MAG: hypothetical protein L3J15_05700 [Devosiaceae bacterium]|nr:hypothetical protein [Devosiaceae bacterium]